MAAPATIERRAAALEVRANGQRLEGYAAVFDSVAKIGRVSEVIASGAFTAALRAQPDILALLDHDAGKVLGRTRSGTLRLAEDSRGLAFSLDLPNTQAGHDVRALAERGDLGGMSFGFLPVRELWKGEQRTLRAVDLREISVVSAWPAYPNTSAELRHLDALRAASEQQRRQRTIKLAEAAAWR